MALRGLRGLRLAGALPRAPLRLSLPAASACLRGFATGDRNARTGQQSKVTNIGATGKTEAESARKYKGSTFPELLEHWSRERFKQVGVGLTAGGAAATLAAVVLGRGIEQAAVLDLFVAFWWYQGFKDINQTSKAIPHNFPVIGNFRYLLESFRPEIRQYFIESDDEATPVRAIWTRFSLTFSSVFAHILAHFCGAVRPRASRDGLPALEERHRYTAARRKQSKQSAFWS